MEAWWKLRGSSLYTERERERERRKEGLLFSISLENARVRLISPLALDQLSHGEGQAREAMR